MAYYRGNFRGIGRMLQRPWLQPPCVKVAEALQTEAESVSPIGDPAEDRHPGLYRASFHVAPIIKEMRYKGQPTQRSGARLVNTAPHAWRVEHGDGRVPRYAPLQRAIDALKAAHG
ncbi:hypothetical protein [Streptomyces zaomyceticus]|uniref:hypothetical protein n=1 Tax=Streptomyces zaomyceticus TaxID=68286 RepID=UPI00344834C9